MRSTGRRWRGGTKQSRDDADFANEIPKDASGEDFGLVQCTILCDFSMVLMGARAWSIAHANSVHVLRALHRADGA
jgi:hypothetical protein